MNPFLGDQGDILHGTKREFDLSVHRNYHDAYHHIAGPLDEVYEHKRIHAMLGYLTSSMLTNRDRLSPLLLSKSFRCNHYFGIRIEGRTTAT